MTGTAERRKKTMETRLNGGRNLPPPNGIRLNWDLPKNVETCFQCPNGSDLLCKNFKKKFLTETQEQEPSKISEECLLVKLHIF